MISLEAKSQLIFFFFFSFWQMFLLVDSKCSISSCVDHSNSDLLPITRLNLGRRIRHVDAEVNVATPTNRFRLGQFECSGRAQGERGEPGPVGPAGARGPSGRSSKSCPRTVGNGSTCSRVANFGCYCIVQLLVRSRNVFSSFFSISLNLSS